MDSHVRPNLAAQDEWLQLGAIEKAQSVISLADPSQTVLEVGAGTGALLEQLAARGFGARYWACEPSRPLYEALTAKNIPGLQSAFCSLLADAPLSSEFDLAILSHVLEHVLDPAALLAETLRYAPNVLLEVPLEGTPAGNLRAALRRLVTRRAREDNSSGHVTFFSPRTAKMMVKLAGGEVVKTRLYFPRTGYAHLANESQPALRVIRRGILAVPDTVIARSYYGHLAMLVRRREPPKAWGHELYLAAGR